MDEVEATAKRFWPKVRKPDAENECWLWLGSMDLQGYGRIRHAGRPWLSHRFSYLLKHGAIPASAGYHGTVIRHTCDTPSCVNPAHLVAGVQLDNVRDMDAKGRGGRVGLKGSAHNMAKLTEADVSAIRRDPRSHAEVGREWLLTPEAISYVRLKGWKHVKTKPRESYQRG